MAVPSLRLLAVSSLLAACANTVAPAASTPDAAPADVPTADVPTADVPTADVPTADAPTADVVSPPVDVPPIVDRPVAIEDVPAPPVDVPTDAPCGGPRALAASVSHAAIERVAGGYVVAWVRALDGVTVARVYDEDLVPLAPAAAPLELRSSGATPDALSLSFSGDTGLVAAGSSLHVLSRAGGTLSLTSTLDLSPRVARGAWVEGPSNFRVVTSDTSFIFTNGARGSTSTPNNASVAPIGAGATVMPAPVSIGGGYLALEDVGGRLRMRQFITGHGSVIQSLDEAGDGASASRVLATDAGLHRLVYGEGREVDVSLEERDPSTLERRTTPAVLHAGAAWNTTTGALAPAGDELFLTWAARPMGGGYNSSLQAQWGARGRRVEAFRGAGDQSLGVLGAAVGPRGAIAWVLFGEAGRSGGAYQLRAQCVLR